MKKTILTLTFLSATLLLGTIKSSAQTVRYTCHSKQSAIACMICNCYHEARGKSEGFSGKVAVNRTVLARVKSSSYPNTACGVIYQDSQFSWTQDDVANNISIPANKPADKAAFLECGRAVDKAVALGSNNVLHFYNPTTAAPRWAKNMKICGTIGNHRYVTPQSSKCPASLGDSNTSSKKPVRWKAEGGIK